MVHGWQTELDRNMVLEWLRLSPQPQLLDVMWHLAFVLVAVLVMVVVIVVVV